MTKLQQENTALRSELELTKPTLQELERQNKELIT
jgi:hypothetical protein